MGMGRRSTFPVVALFAAVVATIPAVTAAPLAPLHSLDASLSPQAPIHSEGNVSAEPGAGFVAAWRIAPAANRSVTYASPFSNLSYVEYRSGQFLPLPGVPRSTRANEGDASVQAARSVQNFTYRRHEVAFLPGVKTMEYAAVPRDGDVVAAGFAAVGAAACDTIPSRIGSVGFHEETVRERPASAPTWLRSTCDADRLELSGAARLFVYNVTLQVDSVDADGTRRQQVFATGETTEPDPLVPGRRVRVVRIAIIDFFTEDARASFGGAQRLTLHAPAFAAVGNVDVPQSVGRIQWAGWRAEGTIVPLHLQGAVALSASDADGMGLRGSTWNAPLSASTSIAGLAAPVALAIAVAAVLAGSWAVLRFGRYVLALFSRFSQETVLEHPARQQIVQAITERPGMQLQDLVELLGIARGAVTHHLSVLTRHGVVVARSVGRHRYLYVRGAAPPHATPPELLRPLAQSLLAAARSEPAPTQQELAQRFGVSQPTVSRILRRLRERGLLQ